MDDNKNTATPLTAENVNAAREEGLNAGRLEGNKAGRTAERQRIQAIINSEESEGRTEMAQHLAFETDMEADAASALLAKSPKNQPEASGSSLDRLMADKSPKVGASASTDSGDETADTMADRIAGMVNPTLNKK